MAILQASERHPTLYEGRDQAPGGSGHALARHYAITRNDLMTRLQKETRNGAMGFFAAFRTMPDMAQAGIEVLNGPAGLWAREQLFGQAATPQRPRGSHTGMRVVINHHGAWICQVRYPGGTGSISIGTFRMVLDRIDDRPFGLHVHTFFPALTLRVPTSHAEARYRDGKLFGRWP